ncbi:MAG: hypothetical protein KKA16_13005 [Alphaproteobacteria bacterium]|nr:hypothetical protein [Alphaproteobacteria bacterium]MBU2379138.1 hypothetical protein [Alphaproteobacteria bacterium]
MNAERFDALARAWGADLRRWPEGERAAARAWVEADSVRAERALFDARQTDAALDASPRPDVSAALRDRVIASAATASLKARAAWPDLRKLLWIGGAGWAAAACAGVVFGTTLGGQMAADTQAFSVLDQAAATGLDDTEILG